MAELLAEKGCEDTFVSSGRTEGYCDGVKGSEVYGWAWRPDFPEQVLDVELSIDGRLHATAQASIYRADLRAAGIGHGRYGWRLPLPADNTHDVQQIVIRVRDGDVLSHGAFEHRSDASMADLDDDEIRGFVDAVLSPQSTGPAKDETIARPITHFLVRSAASPDSHTLGAPEYSYGFVVKAFAPLLEKLGRLHYLASEDGDDRIAEIIDDALPRGEACLLLSFAPPHRTMLAAKCPIVPVVAWEFPTIPDRVLDGDVRHDWRFVLRQTGRAIALSRAAREAMRSTMGSDYPAVAIPTPVWDRFPALQTLGSPPAKSILSIDGFCFDSREGRFTTVSAIPPVPTATGTSGEGRMPNSIEVDGIVFSTLLAPKDGRKNWADIITAFIAAHGERDDMTLIVKMIANDPGLWWWELHELIGRQPKFNCRIVIMHGYMDEDRYNALIAATHWVVNASKAEGQCLPLLEFMCAGRPAIAPSNSAMDDYITSANALVVEGSEEYCGWPHDPANRLMTTRSRIAWQSLRDCFAEAGRLSKHDPAAYSDRAAAARSTIRSYCSDKVVAEKLDAFLGLNLGFGDKSLPPSDLLTSTAVPA